MSDGLAALFWGVITFSLLVVVHEGGHFLAARLFGVKVHEFMVGLPGPAIRFRGAKTTYGVTAIPLGGYVRIAGMEPGPEDPLLGPALAAVTAAGPLDARGLSVELGIDSAVADRLLLTLSDWDAIVAIEDRDDLYRSRFGASEAVDPVALLDRARSVTYRGLSTLKRIIVLSMGVLLNLATAVIVFTLVLSLFGYVRDTGAVGTVSPGSAAETAGVKPGDRIVAVDGEATPEFQDLVHTIAAREVGESVALTFERGGSTETVTATLGTNPANGRAMLGVTPAWEDVRPNPWQAFLLSFSFIGLTFVAIAGFFNPETFAASVSQSSSVIGAAQYAAEAAESGPLDYARIVAALSLSLGVINILPLPPLDGGKIALEVVEKLRGKPLPRAFSVGVSLSGAALLFALIAYLMYTDITRIVGS